MKNKRLVQAIWGVSLLLIGLSTILNAGAAFLLIALPNALSKALGIVSLIALPFLIFSSAKLLSWMKKTER